MSPEQYSFATPDFEPRELALGSAEERLNLLVEQQLDFVWRSLRRLGVPLSGVDDATQQVWLIVARKLPEITLGSERAFLFGTALRVASDARRRIARQREVSGLESFDHADPTPRADEIIDQRKARSVLDEILDSLSDDTRAVFILYELEEQTAAEIAALLGIPPGTVASRLRRARIEFEQIVKRLKARGQIEGSR
ncbi:MAG TPA: sigma-70 family RNA polymerase sigma factor [Polyangiaceae bacterium]|jgi:RNA polymerase sigma-70 factor (ECF subfamily)|nr:sigma-70 family RNA polymerase sigma factor [Polyangiaceae bacterium]